MNTEANVYHVPVLAERVVELLLPAPGKIIVDGTLGGGGHTELLLSRGARVIGFDQDAEAADLNAAGGGSRTCADCHQDGDDKECTRRERVGQLLCRYVLEARGRKGGDGHENAASFDCR